MQDAYGKQDVHSAELERVRLPTGDELLLRRNATSCELRFNGRELMSDQAHWSETALGALACEDICGDKPRVLIGGLGIGYTVRGALDVLPAAARVVLAELVPEVIAWHRGPLGTMAGRVLDDPRVVVAPIDVACRLGRSAERFDAIILDVDNGPDDVTVAGNRLLYSADGLARISRALAPRGTLAVWSAGRSQAFEAQLVRCGLVWESIEVAARGSAGDPKHTIYLAKLGQDPGEYGESCLAE